MPAWKDQQYAALAHLRERYRANQFTRDAFVEAMGQMLLPTYPHLPESYVVQGRLPSNENREPELYDAIKWLHLEWFERVALNVYLDVRGEEVTISTVQFAHAHNGLLHLFESIVFWPGSRQDERTNQYHTREEAVAAHWDLVTRVERALARQKRKYAEKGLHERR